MYAKNLTDICYIINIEFDLHINIKMCDSVEQFTMIAIFVMKFLSLKIVKFYFTIAVTMQSLAIAFFLFNYHQCSVSVTSLIGGIINIFSSDKCRFKNGFNFI